MGLLEKYDLKEEDESTEKNLLFRLRPILIRSVRDVVAVLLVVGAGVAVGLFLIGGAN